VYFSFFSGEKKGKVPKERKAVMPPNTSAVEGFEAITRRSDGEGVCTFFFQEKKERYQRKKPRPSNCVCRGNLGKEARSQGTGLYRAGTLIECKKGLAAKEILRFDRFLVNGEKRNGECASSSLPLEGEGGPPQVGDEVDKNKEAGKIPMHPSGGRSPVRGRGGAPLRGAPVLFSVCRKQNLRPRSYGCSAHSAEKRKFKDFGLKRFDFTGERLRPAVREGFP